MSRGSHQDRASYQGSCCPGEGLRGLYPTLLGGGGCSLHLRKVSSRGATQAAAGGTAGGKQQVMMDSGGGTRNRVLLEALQEEILGPRGTDLQGLPEHQQQTDSTVEEAAPGSLATCGNRASLAPASSYAPTSNR